MEADSKPLLAAIFVMGAAALIAMAEEVNELLKGIRAR